MASEQQTQVKGHSRISRAVKELQSRVNRLDVVGGPGTLTTSTPRGAAIVGLGVGGQAPREQGASTVPRWL
jgi:hypothetical protein